MSIHIKFEETNHCAASAQNPKAKKQARLPFNKKQPSKVPFKSQNYNRNTQVTQLQFKPCN